MEQYNKDIVNLAYDKFNKDFPFTRISLFAWNNQFELDNSAVLLYCKMVVNEIRYNKLKHINDK